MCRNAKSNEVLGWTGAGIYAFLALAMMVIAYVSITQEAWPSWLPGVFFVGFGLSVFVMVACFIVAACY